MFPNDRERSMTSTTACSIVVSPCLPLAYLFLLSCFRRFGGGLVHRRLAFPDHPENFVRGEIQLVRLGQQRVDALLDHTAPFPKRHLLRTPLRDERARPLALVNDSRAFQFAVRLHDRVWRDLQLQRQRPDGRQLFAGLKQPGGDQVFDLVDDLAVDRHAVGQVDGDVQGAGVGPCQFKCMGTLIQFSGAVKRADHACHFR